MSWKPYLLSLLSLLVIAWPCQPSFAHTGKETVQELVMLFSAWSGDEGNSRVMEAAAKRIDYSGMAELAFTPTQWHSLTSTQRRELVDSFRTLVERRYYKRWHKLFHRSHLALADEVKSGCNIYVKSFLTQGKDEDTVIWQLRCRNNDAVVVSLNVNGKDLVTRLGERFQKQLSKRGPDGLIAWIKNKADIDAEDEVAPTAASKQKALGH